MNSYADDLVLITETMEKLKAQFIHWKTAFEGKGLKVMEIGGGGSGGGGGGSRAAVLAKIDLCGVCG